MREQHLRLSEEGHLRRQLYDKAEERKCSCCIMREGHFLTSITTISPEHRSAIRDTNATLKDIQIIL